MFNGRLVMVGSVAVLLSGCAGMQGRQEVTRLQSQLGLLDERVTQLERSSVGAGFSSVTPEDFGTTIEAAPIVESSVTVTPASPSIKPSTRDIQMALQNAGFYQGKVDGKIGPLTREAIREFQRVHGLTDDGAVGKETWTKLQAYADLSLQSGELNAAEIFK